MHKNLIGGLLVVGAFFLYPAHAAAQADTFMFIAGIPGDSTDEGHKDWINVFSVAQNFDVATKGTACLRSRRATTRPAHCCGWRQSPASGSATSKLTWLS